MPGPHGARRGELAVQAVVDVARGDGQVDRETDPRVGRGGLRGIGQEPLAECLPAIGRELEAGRAGVAAVPGEEVAAALQGRAEVHRPVAPARGADHVAEFGADDRGPAAVLGQPPGDESDDADAPRAVEDRGGIGRFGAHPLARLADRDLHEVASGEVGGLEGVGVGGGLDRVLGEQQLGGLERLPHPPGRVEPRRDDERDRLEVDGRGHDPGAFEECRDPGSWRGPETDQPEPRDRPVLPDDRRHVGHGPDRREVREVQGEGGTAGHVGEEQLGDLERDAAPGQPAVGIRGSRGDAG